MSFVVEILHVCSRVASFLKNQRLWDLCAVLNVKPDEGEACEIVY